MTTVGDRLFQYGGTPVGGDLLALHGKGKVRWLDPNYGSDEANGKKPERAWKTLQYAADSLGYIDASTEDLTGFHDIIIRLPGVEEVDTEVRFDGGGVSANPGSSISVIASLSGLRTFGSVFHAHTRMSSGGATSAGAGVNTVVVVRRNINFYGMSFAGRGTGGRGTGDGAALAYRISNDATLDVGSGPGGQFASIRGCNFRDDGGNDTTGLYLYGVCGIDVTNCTFGYSSASRGPNGVSIKGSSTNGTFDIDIRDCLFRQCPIGVIVGVGTGENTNILDCVFQSTTVGILATTGTTGVTGIIDGCRFGTSDGSGSHTNNSGGGSGHTEAFWNSDMSIKFTENTYYLGA